MERLILCGAGHISQQLALMAQHLEFEIIVIDDRPEFANAARFPMANQVLCMPFLHALKHLGSRSSDYYAILTRGHAFDQVCLECILQKHQYTYVGMIGSKSKVATSMQALRQAGYPQEILDQVYAPIGLPIGAQTPSEIAVSILAQLIQVGAEHGHKADLPLNAPGVLCTIVEKEGSAPRGVGTWMLVQETGVCIGSIGGGAVEQQVIKDALYFWKNNVTEQCRVYDLSQDAAELGMVCGGSIKVSFTVRRPI